MKKIIVLCSVLLISNHILLAQNQATQIKQRAMKMATALSSLKLDEYVTYLHPSIINAQGGKEKIKQTQDSIYKYQKMFGVKISKILIGDVSKIEKFNKQQQASFPMTTSIATPMGEMSTKTTIIALSDDNGKNWFFIDGMFYNSKVAMNKLPKLSPKIIIAPMEKPTLPKPKN